MTQRCPCTPCPDFPKATSFRAAVSITTRVVTLMRPILLIQMSAACRAHVLSQHLGEPLHLPPPPRGPACSQHLPTPCPSLPSATCAGLRPLYLFSGCPEGLSQWSPVGYEAPRTMGTMGPLCGQGESLELQEHQTGLFPGLSVFTH